MLQSWGVLQGDRVAYIAPNTHAELESFYAVPQIGAVIVPLNYRLTGDDFAYMIDHSGSRVVCVHSDYLDTVDAIKHRCPKVTHWVALEGARAEWLDYEVLITAASPEFEAPPIDESDLLAINYTSGTTSRHLPFHPRSSRRSRRHCGGRAASRLVPCKSSARS